MGADVRLAASRPAVGSAMFAENVALPEPASLVSRHQIVERTMNEAHFLEWALAEVNSRQRICFLDSAGPIGARSNRAVVSGNLAGMFIQTDGLVVYEDFENGGQCRLTEEAFASWLADFAKARLGEDGPCLFPLLTYEAFNPYVAPALAHPLWREGQAVWLVARDWFRYDRQRGCLRGPAEVIPPPAMVGAVEIAEDRGWRESEAVYGEHIGLLLDDIREGQFYQANLSQRFIGETTAHPLETYRRLRALNPSPFMGVFRLGASWVLSGSPERLANRYGEALSARPIAGTQPRFTDVQQDDQSQRHLQESPKERAEHLMLVDLIRNDLGRIARAGSVQVTSFAEIETYSHVHHLVSQVEALAQSGLTPVAFIRAMFPGGTITGAPKIACMQKLVQLEREARGPYTGSMGLLDTNEDWDLNILIRTLVQVQDAICFHGGGGIVADSHLASEYRETRQKCLALMEALQIEC